MAISCRWSVLCVCCWEGECEKCSNIICIILNEHLGSAKEFSVINARTRDAILCRVMVLCLVFVSMIFGAYVFVINSINYAWTFDT